MSATTWGKFYWADWRSDPKLRMCSLAARGLWIDILSIMAEAEGYLLINGTAPTPAMLARIIGATADEVEAGLGELEAAGVFSRDRRRVIYSRRMVADEQKRRIGRETGLLGGNPSLRKDKENCVTHKGEANGGDNVRSGVSQRPETRDQKTRSQKGRDQEARDQTEPLLIPASSAPVSKADVERVWTAASLMGRRRSSRDLVAKALAAALARGATIEEVLGGVRGHYSSDDATKKGGQYAKGLHRLIDQDQWRDWVGEEEDCPEDIPDWIQRARMRDFRENPLQWREHERGPKPGQKGCRVPDAIQREFGITPFSAEEP